MPKKGATKKASGKAKTKRPMSGRNVFYKEEWRNHNAEYKRLGFTEANKKIAGKWRRLPEQQKT
jgi:hypothetical protein